MVITADTMKPDHVAIDLSGFFDAYGATPTPAETVHTHECPNPRYIIDVQLPPMDFLDKAYGLRRCQRKRDGSWRLLVADAWAAMFPKSTQTHQGEL